MDNASKRSLEVSSSVYAGAGAMAGLHSFFALAIAISLGPQQGVLSTRQFLLGSIMATAGTVIALIQLRWGTSLLRDMSFAISRDKPDSVAGPFWRSERVILLELPPVLLSFWGAIWLWLLFAR